MQTVFLELVKLSLIGSLFAAAVMLVRLIFRKAPKWLFCVLWGIVALRLICPVSIKSDISLVPDKLATGQIITNVGNEYIGDVDIIYESNADYSNAIEAGRQPIRSNDGNYVVTEKDSLEAPKTVAETVYPVLSWVWVGGMVLMITYTAVSYLVLRKKMEEATQLRENVWQCEQVDSPFVLGFIKPRIYLPYAINDSDMANVIAHEQAHIQRKDHWWKPIGFLLLSIHWFNPVLWLSYILLCRDIEAACDEKVIKHMDKDEMRTYSTALLHCSVHRRRIAACPLAFGEIGVKERIKHVMNYKKPAFWIILLTVIASVVVSAVLLTNPAGNNQERLMGASYGIDRVLYDATGPKYTDTYSRFCITGDLHLYAQINREESWSFGEKMEPYPITAEMLKKYASQKESWKTDFKIQEITDAYVLRKEINHFFIAMQTKKGETLLAFGSGTLPENADEYSSDVSLLWIYKLGSECSSPGMISYDFLELSLKEIGKVECFEFCTPPNNPDFIVVGFMARYSSDMNQYQDMGFAVFETNGTGFRLLNYHVYEDAVNKNNGIVFCDHPAVLSLDGEMRDDVTFDVILSCNEDLHKIQREYFKDGKLVNNTASMQTGDKSMSLFCWTLGDDADKMTQTLFDKNGNEINNIEETTHNHIPVEQRQADSFILHAEERGEITDYSICYEEPDGCITPVVQMADYEQQFMIHDNLIYFVGINGSTKIFAVDFSGKVQKECVLNDHFYSGYILYSDDKHIYGAAGNATSNANYIFQADWDLTECKQINAFPKQFRQFDYEKVGKDFAELCQADISKIYVHGANVLFDANGMAYEMFLRVSAVTDSETISGNLLLKWYNQLPAYDTWDMNPWFNKVDEGYGSTEGLMTLDDFLTQLKGIEDTSVVPENLPAGTKPFRLTYGTGTPEELPTAQDAGKVYVELTNGTLSTIAQPDTTKDYFSIVSKNDNAIIGTLYILAKQN